jgi:phosphatidylserine synthase 2
MDSNVKLKDNVKRNVGLQTYIYPKEYISARVAVQHNLEHLDYSNIWTIPHSISALFLISIFLYSFGIMNISTTTEERSKHGIIALLICALVFGTIYLPDSILKRPHPAFWRFIQSISILYLLFIVYLLFQNLEEARNQLKFFDLKLGVNLPEKIYGMGCEITKPSFPYINIENLSTQIDFYAICHLLGWIGKSIFIRDFYICWALSVTWEIIELTLKTWLPNFNECWWDAWILDVMVCNAAGIYLGHKLCEFFQMQNYSWLKKNFIDNKLKFVKTFVPNTFERHEWKIFSSSKRFITVIWLILLLQLTELSHFFLKHLLWIPGNHYILLIRVLIWVCLAAIAVREYYEYATNKHYLKFGQYIWLAHLTLVVEYLIIYKFGRVSFKFEDINFNFKMFWCGLFLVIISITIFLIYNESFTYSKKKNIEDILIFNNNRKQNILEPTIDIEYVDECCQTNFT